MTGEALKKLQQQMKVNREERRLTVRHVLWLAIEFVAVDDDADDNKNNKNNNVVDTVAFIMSFAISV